MKYPTTTEEQIIKLAEEGSTNRNWLYMVAHESGVDYDEDTNDEFNRNNQE